MLNLFSICSDLKNQKSIYKNKTIKIITDIYNHLNKSSIKTKNIISGWLDEFKYIYGDTNTNLSSNSKLDIKSVFLEYKLNYSETNDNVLLLFFSIQTYFTLLIKIIMNEILETIYNKHLENYEYLISGKFSEKFGIKNYVFEDWYCWPIFELTNHFDLIINEIISNVKQFNENFDLKEFSEYSNYDYIKQIYEAIIPKELRHALGEYYTPDWLAEKTLKDAVSYFENDINCLRIIDPTCGSGTFLFKIITLKRRSGCSLQEILKTTFGTDINPIAVLTAKTNYLLSIIDLLSSNTEISIPVYHYDVLSFNKNIENHTLKNTSLTITNNPSEYIKYSLAKDFEIVSSLKDFDIVIGNPPWVNWEYMPIQYRQASQHLWLDYKLFNAKGRDLSFSKEDISVLITYIVIDKLLKNEGILAFVIRQGVFKSAQNGIGFRKFLLKDEIPIKVLKVDDLSKIKAFDNATNSTAIFLCQKGKINQYPVKYNLWNKRNDLTRSSFNSYSTLQEVLNQISIEEQCAIPAVKKDITSIWVTTQSNNLSSLSKILGTNNYRARTGVFTGGANAVYWLNIIAKDEDNILITNIVERAKRKSEKITTTIEPTYVFPMLKGSNVKRWNITYDTYILCPHTAETKMWPVKKEILKSETPFTFNYLYNFKSVLDGRNGFAGWEKEIQQKEFHSILRVGEYTFSKFKVIWKYISTEFVCAVISSVEDSVLGSKLILPNEKIMYVSFDNEEEAYYLCGILSSSLVSECVKSYMNPTSISAHVLNKLNIPKYDSKNKIHNEISKICKDGHGKEDIIPYIKKIDELILYIF